MHFLQSDIIRTLDNETINSGTPGIALMERAGYEAFRFLINIASPSAQRFLIAAGKGNNAGDAFVVARYLIQANKHVDVILLTDPQTYKGDALVNWQKLAEMLPSILQADTEEKINNIEWHGDIVIDGVLGTGIRGEVKGVFKTAIDKITAMNIPVFSLDIPSGINCDTGQVCGTAVKAKWTCTFAHPKLAVLSETGAHYCGRVEIIDIGIPKSLTDKILEVENAANTVSALSSTEIADCIPHKKLNDHKGTYGHLLIVAGSRGMTGAATLCAKAAIESGVGMVTLAIPESLLHLVAQTIPSCMTIPVPDSGKGYFTVEAAEVLKEKLTLFDAVAFGPGIGQAEETVNFTAEFITAVNKLNKPLIIDADGINAIADNHEVLKMCGGNVLLTPHPGEFARLTGVKPGSNDTERITAAKQFAQLNKTNLLLKGFHTVIADSTG
ncbi:MAG: NAD(P)H-hydrate dehydratase, partial [Victivallaceae bacterium]|nr:NAD(P)H-hydrate dehydratase [Victivallaceae bacterium]